jgi:hypothetical protein
MTDDRSHGPHGWKAHAEGQAAAWAQLSHLERLRWLQSAKQFAKLATDAAARRLADAVLTGAAPADPTRKPSPG